MKTVTILENVSIPNMPGFRKGQEVNVADHIAELLVDRAHAKYHLGKPADQVQKEREKEKEKTKNAQPPKPEVAVSQTDEKGNKKDFSNN